MSPAGLARAKAYDVGHTPDARFDGAAAITAGGDEADAARVFAAYKSASLAPEDTAHNWRIQGTATVSNGEITGQVDVDGPANQHELRLLLVLCERIVMVPGANGLVLSNGQGANNGKLTTKKAPRQRRGIRLKTDLDS